MFDIAAHLLAERGIATLKFDFRGHGESSGSGEDFSIVGQLIDIEAALQWVRHESGAAGAPISFLGVSFGGGAGALFEHSWSAFDRLTFFAPVLDYSATFLSGLTAWSRSNFGDASCNEALTENFLLLDGQFKIGHRLLKEMPLLNPLAALRRISKPLQFFHGTADSLVPCRITQDAVDGLPNADVHIIQGMGHGLYVSGDESGVSAASKNLQETYYTELTKFLSS